MPPPQENILTAIAVNECAVRTGSDARKQGIALSWLFHLIGDIHPPVHAVTLFSREYPKGDEDGTDTCVRVAQGRAALSLHQLWDELLTSSNNTRTLRNMAVDLRNRFPRNTLTGLGDPGFCFGRLFAAGHGYGVATIYNSVCTKLHEKILTKNTSVPQRSVLCFTNFTLACSL